MRFLTEFQKAIKKAKTIAIFTHKNSDHDTICSGLALQNIIKQMGKDSVIFVDKKPNQGIMKFVPENVEFETTSDKIFDVGISVDCAQLKMLSEESIKIFSACTKTFNIDHHQDNGKFAQSNWVKKGWTSCCEVIYWLFYKKIKMNTQLAEWLYTGIYMDCGSFTYSSVNTKTHHCVAELMKYCPEVNKNFFICFGITGQENFEITQRAFKSVQFFYNKQIAVSILRKQDFEASKCNRENGKFIVSYLQNIASVKIAISISEDKTNEWRISLRTHYDNVDVSKIAHHFNGGGHFQASGLTLKGELDKALNALICECKKELRK